MYEIKNTSEKTVKLEQSIWSVKINNQPLYSKEVDGRTVLFQMTQEENEKVEEVLEKAITDCSRILSGGAGKRARLASQNADENEESENMPKQSTWTVRINTQLLYKKTLNGRTILFGMNEDEHKKVAKVMDQTFDELAEILKDKTEMRETEVEEKEQVTIADGAMFDAAMQKEVERFEADKASKKENDEPVENDKLVNNELRDKVIEKLETTNELRDEIQEDKKKNAGSSFWDKLK